MITITKDVFEQIISSATNSSSEVFDMIYPHFTEVEECLYNELLGVMAGKFDSVPGLEECVTRLVCLRTYAEQIPHLDLVLTPTGFTYMSLPIRCFLPPLIWVNDFMPWRISTSGPKLKKRGCL